MNCGSGRQAQAPKGRLLYVPAHTEKVILEDLERAGIPHWTPQGKVDFHALRGAFINLVIESGATVKEAQALARHSTPDLTMNVYGRTRPERLQETIEKISRTLLSEEKVVPGLYRQAVGAEIENATPSDSKELRLNKLAPAVGLESISSSYCGATISEHNPHKSKRPSALPQSPSPTPEQKSALPEHSPSTSAPPEHVPSMYPPDLVQVVEAWNRLPEAVKAGILAMVKASR